jgi:UDP-GlcNAc:undecaprenyl-phosphate GlcNAc-1-phosphate transferase
VSKLGTRYGFVDHPSERKVHNRLIPRIGGVAIYISFFLPFIGFLFYSNPFSEQFFTGRFFWLFAGATLIFLMGLLDDILGLGPNVKFAVQIVSALLACQGGLRISAVTLPWGPTFLLDWLAVPVTVFWFLLVVNAINLIDGLDGLAAGITLFVSLTLLLLNVINGNFLTSIGLAAIAGASCGFLFFNFSPASIFMGDSGSYLLGFLIASLSLLGSFKSQTAFAILIPVIALGVPLFDAILAPIRRFIFGKKLFSPDKGHIHHKLLSLGLTQRNVVLIIYASTVCLSCFGLLLAQVTAVR